MTILGSADDDDERRDDDDDDGGSDSDANGHAHGCVKRTAEHRSGVTTVTISIVIVSTTTVSAIIVIIFIVIVHDHVPAFLRLSRRCLSVSRWHRRFVRFRSFRRLFRRLFRGTLRR